MGYFGKGGYNSMQRGFNSFDKMANGSPLLTVLIVALIVVALYLVFKKKETTNDSFSIKYKEFYSYWSWRNCKITLRSWWNNRWRISNYIKDIEVVIRWNSCNKCTMIHDHIALASNNRQPIKINKDQKNDFHISLIWKSFFMR